MPLKDLQVMADEGYIQKNYAKYPQLVCMACQFGAAHRKPWRTSGKQKNIIKTGKIKHGDCASTDSFVSSTQVLIPQQTGKQINTKYTTGTVFVEHAIYFACFHNQIT